MALSGRVFTRFTLMSGTAGHDGDALLDGRARSPFICWPMDRFPHPISRVTTRVVLGSCVSIAPNGYRDRWSRRGKMGLSVGIDGESYCDWREDGKAGHGTRLVGSE